MTPQQKRALTLSLNALLRAQRGFVMANERTLKKTMRHRDRAKTHVYIVVQNMLQGLDMRNCTCAAKVDITFMGHLPDCPLRGL